MNLLLTNVFSRLFMHVCIVNVSNIFCWHDVAQGMWNTRIWSKVWIMLCLTKYEVRLTRNRMPEMKPMGNLGNSCVFVVSFKSNP